MRLVHLSLTLFVAFMLTACASIRPEPPEVQLAGLEIRELSLTHANFLANLRLYNPNAINLDIEGIDFTLYLNDIRVAKGKTVKTFNIPAEEFGDASLHLASSFLDLLQLTTGLQNKEQITYRIAGHVKVGGMGLLGMSIPIDREGSLPLTGSLQQLAPSQPGGISTQPTLPGQELLLGR